MRSVGNLGNNAKSAFFAETDEASQLRNTIAARQNVRAERAALATCLYGAGNPRARARIGLETAAHPCTRCTPRAFYFALLQLGAVRYFGFVYSVQRHRPQSRRES